MADTKELTAKLKAAEETVELQRFKLERQAEDLHQAKSLESIHRDKRYEVEREFNSYKHDAERNSYRLASEVCRLEDELEAAQSRIASLEARTLNVNASDVMRVVEGKNHAPGRMIHIDTLADYCTDAGIKLQIEGE